MDDDFKPTHLLAWSGAVLLVLLLIVGLLIGVWAGVAAFSRYQTLAEARNQVQVNDIRIAQTQQLVQVEQQKAQIRIADARGIATSQQIISGSLTSAYLEYLAIQAQQEMATHDHTATVYIPVGPNGIPVVATQPVNGR